MTKLRQLLQPLSVLFSNALWLFSAELIAKLSRIVTIIVLAVALTPVSYGTAMLALACHDMLALLLRAGVGTQIIRCHDNQLQHYARCGAAIQWGICLTLAFGQWFVAEAIALWYDNPDLVMLLQVMALTYLFYPWVSIKVFLLQRANKIRYFGTRNGICVSIENLSIALFAWWQADFMAVAYGKLVFSVLWLVLFWRAPVKNYGIGYDLPTMLMLLRTSGQLFSSELFRTLRLHADTFIAAKVLTPELFGFYSFAKNAGIGLSQSISNVFNNALYPFLCKLQRQQSLDAHQSIIYLTAIAVGFIFVLQALLVPIYLPLLFDEKWQHMTPVVSVMCLIALPSTIVDTYCCFERAKAQFNHEIVTRFICLTLTLLMLLMSAPSQPMAFALTMLASATLCGIATYFGQRFIGKITDGSSLFNRSKSHEY